MATDPGDLDRLFAEYLNAGDLEGLMTLYEPGCRLVRRDGSVAAGHDEIRVMLGRLVEMRPAFRTEAVKVVGTGHDLALVYSDWNMAVKRPDGTLNEMSGKALEVVRRQQGGGWRIAIDDPFARG
jgi:uncharacterized protein (TIGR02246 family)